jgi:hypothetical protein
LASGAVRGLPEIGASCQVAPGRRLLVQRRISLLALRPGVFAERSLGPVLAVFVLGRHELAGQRGEHRRLLPQVQLPRSRAWRP